MQTVINIQEVLSKQPILLIDGECGFCNKSVQFFLKREKKEEMHFAPLESVVGKELRKYFEISEKVESLILIKNHSAYVKSCAALRLTLYMKGLWPILTVFLIIPPFMRNVVYNFIARHRMKLFGRVESCSLISESGKKRFLDRIYG